MEENKEPFRLFENCCTQLRSSGFGLIGFDYNAFFQVAEVIGIKVDSEMMDKIRQMEVKYIGILSSDGSSKHKD